MSYSIREGVDDNAKKAKALAVVLKRYPDATLDALPDGTRVWTATEVKPRASLLSVCVANGTAYLCAYEDVEGVRVYQRYMPVEHASFALSTLQIHHPKAYAALVDCARGKPLPKKGSRRT